MAIIVTCQCGKIYAAKDEFAGRQLKYPACGQLLVVPQPASPDAGLNLGDLSGFDLGAPGAADPLAMGGGPTLPAAQFLARPGAAGGYGARPKPPEKTSVWLIVAMAGGSGVAVITLLFILFMVFFRGGDELGGEAGEVADATNLLSRIRASVC